MAMGDAYGLTTCIACDVYRAMQGNMAMGDAYGPSVASSPFSLSASPLIPYYSSNSDLPVRVDVLDYYGQLASGRCHAGDVQQCSGQ
jgi:hypothetical protein